MCNNQYNMTQCSGFGLPMSLYQKLPNQQKNIIHVTNNRAKYYSELALKYKNEAKELRDSAKYYSEQNSDVTLAYVNSTAVSLQRAIDSKQDLGDYALSSDIPQNVSELTNDSQYINDTELQAAVSDCESYTDTAVATLSNSTDASLILKADTALSNVTTSAQVMMSALSMPSDTTVTLSVGAAGTVYTAPANGWFGFSCTVSNSGFIGLYSQNLGISSQHAGGNDVYMPVKKNKNVSISYGGNVSGFSLRFIYAQGSESEAS